MTDSPLLTRPHLQIAALCEKHLVEADGVITLVRIVDRFTLIGTTEMLQPTFLQFTLVVCFKSGPFRGKLPLSILPINPSHQPMSETRVDMNFEGDDDRGVNVIGQVRLQVAEEGLYWMIISLAGEEYSRIPFRVIYQRMPMVLTGS